MGGFSFKWFNQFFSSYIWMRAFKNSIIVALGTTLLCLGLALPAAQAFRCKFPMKIIIELIFTFPFYVPAILVAIGLLITATSIGLYGNIFLPIIGHVVWSVTIVFITLSAALMTVDRSIEEAARSLGASDIRVFLKLHYP
jgi:ABC-type spermidine/putrescine transport system permease subunit II